MAFTTPIFLFVFFPIAILGYYAVALLQRRGPLAGFLVRIRAADLWLIGIGCIFYMWACFDDVFRLLIYIVVVYLLGRALHNRHRSDWRITLTSSTDPGKTRTLSAALPLIVVAVTLMVCILIYFKYTSLLASGWTFLFKDSVRGRSVIAPLGLSFITFSSISYLADVYLGKAEAGSLIDCMLYLSFFPKVISGPIVLWRDFDPQLRDRRISLQLMSDGVGRIMIGFAKKLILADVFGACIASAPEAVDVPTAFGIALLYMLQIYYDFSGYSDIAIGLSGMLGFQIRENFNFPYLSCSITEFWRRWHISLGTWFREYVYFPLGGSRAGKARTILNLGIVFLLTGIWHGAGWTYMLWGAVNGLCNIAEKLLAGKPLYEKTPKSIRWALTMGITYFSWELFRFTDMAACGRWFMTMFGLRRFESIPYTWSYFFDAQMITLMAIGILGATIWGWPKVQKVYRTWTATRIGYLVQQVVFVGLFMLSIVFMVNSKYSPFIYFQY